MNNEELLQQIASMMEQQTQALTEEIDRKIKASETRLETKIQESGARLEARLEAKIHESETRTNIKMENDICKRIDALFDGYKLTHEKQWELEHRLERVERKLGMAV